LLSCIFILKKRKPVILTLHAISAFQFKNYSNSSYTFSERIIGICGENGIGKTNLLDAIYSLCFTRSYFNRSDVQNVQHNKEGYRIEGSFEKNGHRLRVVSILRENGKKEFLLDETPYDRLARHIGLLPAVIIVPDDLVLIIGGSEERRRFMDTLFSQVDPEYLQHLIGYNKVLQQRNAYLKSLDDRLSVNDALLEVYDQQLVDEGTFIYQRRQLYLAELIPRVNAFYTLIAGKNETIGLSYESQLTTVDFRQQLLRTRNKDLLLQRTNTGIHKDELIFTIAARAFKAEASQGQRKSLLFAVKLAEFEMLRSHKGFAPLLLLDDVFEKLDEFRISNLLKWVCTESRGQIFITDTSAQRFAENINVLGIKYQLITI
jgi:DNA replication and repair protein RecF